MITTMWSIRSTRPGERWSSGCRVCSRDSRHCCRAIWALTGLSLLAAGVARRSSALRHAGLALFGVSLAKIFLYDLAELSAIARAASFLAVGGLLLAGGFLVQRLSEERPTTS